MFIQKHNGILPPRTSDDIRLMRKQAEETASAQNSFGTFIWNNSARATSRRWQFSRSTTPFWVGVSTQEDSCRIPYRSMYDQNVSDVYSFALSLRKIFTDTPNCVIISATKEQKWVNASDRLFHQIQPSNMRKIIHKSYTVLEPGFRSNRTRTPYIRVNKFKWGYNPLTSSRDQVNTLLFCQLTGLTVYGW